ncbi:methionyl-tRNA formyltransferase [Candidatus Uhrbacteria bacterium]|nr:methionyl-tRNA formyltransferase [Candidatus Uhrbacteria bacterium]MBT7717419.1 methionyl-tRNA formyltransferase [Candidatus Uhrbacteria bacterium]
MIKTVFFGTPEFAKEFLATLHADEVFSIKGVVCQPDKPVGRKKILTAPETKIFSQENDIAVFQPDNLRTSNIAEELKKLEADLFVIIAYGKIIPQEVLDIPKLGTVNVHPSLLPKYRGPSPIQSTILNEESETAVSIMLVDDKMDHGPILSQQKMKIGNDETSTSLRAKAAKTGAPLLIDTIKKYVADKVKPQEQDHEQATFCKMLTKADGKINWNQPADAIYAQFRALIEWPGVFTIWKRNETKTTIKIHDLQISDKSLAPGLAQIEENRLFIGTKTKVIEVLELQPQNSSKMSATAFIQGHKDLNNTILG